MGLVAGDSWSGGGWAVGGDSSTSHSHTGRVGLRPQRSSPTRVSVSKKGKGKLFEDVVMQNGVCGVATGGGEHQESMEVCWVAWGGSRRRGSDPAPLPRCCDDDNASRRVLSVVPATDGEPVTQAGRGREG